MKNIICLAAVAALLFSGAASLFAQEGEGAGGTAVPKDTCVSGMKWTAGNQESPLMDPGGSCIVCHASRGGPRFIVAGTVYRELTEPNDCFGVEGAVVQLKDAKGKLVKLTTVASGNFFLQERGNALALPFTASVTWKGGERKMMSPQSSGNCADCHTAKGANGAPGRVIAPAPKS
jgi:mono/diheme cytochrome c family protein